MGPARQPELLSARRFLEETLANLNEVVLLVDLRTLRFVYANRTTERVLGYAPSELVGQEAILLHVDRQAHDDFARRTRKALEREAHFVTEFQLRRKDGQIIQTDHTITRLQGGDGTPPTAISLVRDISLRKAAEQSLRESEQRYRLLADNTLDMIWSLDLEGRFIYVNPAIERINGYTPAEFIGHHPLEFVDEAAQATVRTAIAETLSEDRAGEGRLLLLDVPHKDGSRVPLEIRIAAAFDEQGRTIGLQGTARDVSERKKLEAQVIEAQKMDALGQFSGGIAHDFNNLLGIILGFAQTSRLQLDPEDPVQDGLQQIEEAAERGATLTRQLLSFARRQPARPQVVDLNECAASMLKMLRRVVPDDIQLVWIPGVDVPPVRVDPGQLDQLFANLTLNARDAVRSLRDRKGIVTVTTDRSEEGENGMAAYAILSVADNGIGMDDETRARVSEPFFSTKQDEGGTGLGLAVVYGIVKHNKGLISINSEPGVGSVFRVSLPAMKSSR